MYCSVSERTTSKLCSTCLMVTGKPKRFAPRWMSLATRLTFSTTCGYRFTGVSLQRGFFGGVVKWLWLNEKAANTGVL